METFALETVKSVLTIVQKNNELPYGDHASRGRATYIFNVRSTLQCNKRFLPCTNFNHANGGFSVWAGAGRLLLVHGATQYFLAETGQTCCISTKALVPSY